MEHVVFYPSAEGGSAFKRVNSLDEAVAFVEHLRNSENITEFSVHTLTLVPLSFRAYYHVEVPAEDAASEPVAETPEPVTEEPPAAPDAEVEVAPADAEAAADSATVEVPAQADAPESPEASAADAVTIAPLEAVDEDRSEEWVAEAAVVEAPAVEAPAVEVPAVEVPAVEVPAAEAEAATVEEPVVAAGPFAEAPPVTPQGTEDVVPVPTGKRSMGFFAR